MEGDACELYDREGTPITLDEWMAFQEDPDYYLVAVTFHDIHRVETVWTGVNYLGAIYTPNHGMTIFETRIYTAGIRQVSFPDNFRRLVSGTLTEASYAHKRAAFWLRCRVLAERAAQEIRPLVGI